jgi:hypothetical protein
MNDYIGLSVLIIALISYVFFFKEKLIKWEERDSVEKSYSIKLVVILVVCIILFVLKIIKTKV